MHELLQQRSWRPSKGLARGIILHVEHLLCKSDAAGIVTVLQTHCTGPKPESNLRALHDEVPQGRALVHNRLEDVRPRNVRLLLLYRAS